MTYKEKISKLVNENSDDDFLTGIDSTINDFYVNDGYAGLKSILSKEEFEKFKTKIFKIQYKLVKKSIKENNFKYLALLPLYTLQNMLTESYFIESTRFDKYIDVNFMNKTIDKITNNTEEILKNITIKCPKVIDYVFLKTNDSNIAYSIIIRTTSGYVAQRCLEVLFKNNAIGYIRRYFGFILKSKIFDKEFEDFSKEYILNNGFNNIFSKSYCDLDLRIFDFNGKFKKEIEEEINKFYETGKEIQSNYTFRKKEFWKRLGG